MCQYTSDQRHNHTATTVSINDLISNLYIQAEQTSLINTAQNATDTQSNLSSAFSSSNVVNDDDNLDDSSWDFKDASQMTVESEASLSSMGDTYMSVSSKLKLNSYLDFYSKLKKELCFVAKCHIENLKVCVKGKQLHNPLLIVIEFLKSVVNENLSAKLYTLAFHFYHSFCTIANCHNLPFLLASSR